MPSPLELGGLALVAAVLVGIRFWLHFRPWVALARAYPHPGAFPAATVHVLGAEINGLVPREGILLGADDRGLHVASARRRRQALVPWPAVRAAVWPAEAAVPERRGEGLSAVLDRHAGGGLPASLMFGPAADQWLYLPLPAALELAALAADHWPGSRRLVPSDDR